MRKSKEANRHVSCATEFPTIRMLITICKAILAQAWSGPEGSRRVKLPDIQTIGT